MKGRQFFWTAFCLLSLLEYQVAGDETTSTITTPSATLSPETSNSSTESLTITNSAALPTKNPTTPSSSTTRALPENSTETNNKTNDSSSSPTLATKTLSTNTTVQTSPTQENISDASTSEKTLSITSASLLTSASTVQPKRHLTGSPTTIQSGGSTTMFNITCVNIKKVTFTEVICLELNQTYSCHQFEILKGMGLSKVVCKENQASCHIKLTESEVNHNCVLLIEAANKGANALEKILQEHVIDLEQLGIKPHKQEDIWSHKDYSRKTLIALVTSGLLLAFLGLAGYFLMKRRSWSPMGERLGEDPYYTENGSHGNTAVSVSSHEQSDLQDKPNFNGGARENGTGQPTSKNGHSTKPHVVADTEL